MKSTSRRPKGGCDHAAYRPGRNLKLIGDFCVGMTALCKPDNFAISESPIVGRLGVAGLFSVVNDRRRWDVSG
ncbi:hypothetical protein WG622_02525 [Cognatishimia sp. D5M38]|uniref:Uncharacterized protein n=1 Tax=Cognatishimia coralii TaxID=3083254 RepID=A0ABU8QCF9_9RHOB